MGIKEAHPPWSKSDHEYIGVELLVHYIKVALPLSKTRTLIKEATMEHPLLYFTRVAVIGNLVFKVVQKI